MLFPPERLAKVDGVSSGKVYLAVLGTMFDVTKGRAHYGALSRLGLLRHGACWRCLSPRREVLMLTAIKLLSTAVQPFRTAH